jgi:hypothetical protein
MADGNERDILRATAHVERGQRCALWRPRDWEIVIGGFRQQTDEPTGIQKLWLKLGRFRGPHRAVLFREWHTDWRELAEQIATTSEASPGIRVYAYSWGAGDGCMTLARELLRRGLDVQQAILADPVYRSRTIFGRWLALLPNPEIVVPRNVRRVQWTRQKTSCPAGHNLRAESPWDAKSVTSRVIAEPHWRDRAHTWMDEDPLFHEMAIEAAEAVR